MDKERINQLVSAILDVSETLGKSIDKVEDKLIEGVGRDLKNTIKILEVLEKFNRNKLENIMMINKASRARQLLKIVDEEGKMYRVEGKKKGKTEWELIFRTRDLVVADTAADEYRKKYAAVRVGEETPDGLKPIKGRGMEEEEKYPLDKIVTYWHEELSKLVQTSGTDYYQPDVDPEEYARTTIEKMLPKLKAGGYKGALSRNPALKKAAMRAGIKTTDGWNALFLN
jgi:DNA topoisomerase IB